MVVAGQDAAGEVISIQSAASKILDAAHRDYTMSQSLRIILAKGD